MKTQKLLLFFIFFLFFSSVSAVGIRGADLSFVIDFEPNGEFEYTYKVHPDSGKVQDYLFYAKGDLEEHITFTPEKLYDVSGSESPSFKAKISFPDSIEPGLHRQEICVGEGEAEGTGGISVKTAACAAIKVLEVYPEVYLLSEIESNNANIGDPVVFDISVENWGRPNISNLYADIDIFEEEKKIETISTDVTSLNSREKKTLTTNLDTSNYDAGNYRAVAKLKYESKEDILNTSFKIGQLSINILNYTKETEIDSVNEFFVEVESGWNTKIENIYADVKVSKEGETLSSFKTVSESLDPWDTKKLVGYVDTTEFESLGEYDVSIDVQYAGETESTSGKINVVEKTKEEKPIDTTTIIMGAAIVIIIILVVLLLKNRNGKKK